jgi:hypothetical protein
MDSFAPYRPGRATTVAPAPVLRGLRMPDFDAPPERHDTAAEDAERAARDALAATARAEGHAAGMAEGWRQASETESAQVAAALRAVAAAMDTAVAAATAAVDEASINLAKLLLAVMDAALPAASAKRAADTALLLAAELKPGLEAVQGLRLYVAAGLGPACAAAINDPRIEVDEDPTMAPGDARAAWRGGGASIELARQRERVAEVLRTLGLGE